MNVNIDLQKDEPIAILGKNSSNGSIEFNGDINVLESKDDQLDPDEGFDDYASKADAKSQKSNKLDQNNDLKTEDYEKAPEDTLEAMIKARDGTDSEGEEDNLMS